MSRRSEFVDEITAEIHRALGKTRRALRRLGGDHRPAAQGMCAGNSAALYDEGQIYKDKQAGYYSVRQEQFLTDKERGPDGEFGPEWGQVEFREEENYYFKLEQHKEWLLRHHRQSHRTCRRPISA